MEIAKNKEYRITIEDMTLNGEGVGKIDGYALFVKDAVPGDIITAKVTKAKKNYGYGRLMEIIVPSPDRVEPPCPVAKACGGCTLMALSYPKQLEFKTNLIRNNLSHIGGLTDIEVPPVIGMDNPYRYRNKAQFPVGEDCDGNIITGFYAGRTHSIIPCEDCIIGSDVNAGILAKIKGHMLKYNIKPYNEELHSGLVRHILIRIGAATGQIMVCIVINGDRIKAEEELVKSLKETVFSGERKIAFTVAVELSYLKEEEQYELHAIMDLEQCTPSLSQACRLKVMSQHGTLDMDAICMVLEEEKPNQREQIKLRADSLAKYFPKDYTPKQKTDLIEQILKEWYEKQEYSKQEILGSSLGRAR